MKKAKKETKGKSFLYRGLMFGVTVLMVAMAIFFTLNRDFFNMDGFVRWLTYGELEWSVMGESNPFVHGGGDQSTFALVDSGAMMVSRSGSRYYSFFGETYGEHVLAFLNPVLHLGGKTAVLYDAGGKTLQVYGEEEEKFSLGLGQEDVILSARLNQNDWMAVTTQHSGYRGVVTVYNASYQKMVDISLSSASIVDAFVSPDNQKVAVITIGQVGGSFRSELLMYSLQAEEPEATLQFPGVLVLDMDYEGEHLWILCEDRLIIVDLLTMAQATWSFGGQYLKDSDLGGDGFATLLLGQYRAGSADRLVTVDPMGQILGEQPLRESPLSMDSQGRYVAYLSGSRFVLYTPDLQEYSSLEEIRHANKVAVTKGGMVLLASNQEAWLYLPN